MPASIPRRHDLDALRAIAMLMGIALHGALAYMPLPEGGWPVQDARQHEAFAVFMAAVHGFRMPLFFLISGFFTAMLWRKRGLQALIEHRAKRILLPLAIGMFTFVPAVWIVSIAAGVTAPAAPISRTDAAPETSLWAAAKHGNLAVIAELLQDGAALNEHDRATGMTPLSMAALHDQHESVELLINSGADVDMKNRDGGRPIHVATFFGHAATVRVLVDHGADVTARDASGKTPAELLGTDWMTTQFIAGMAGVEIDQEKVKAGRKEIANILPASAELTQQAESKAELNQGLFGIYMLLTMFPFFHHLWFLAFLCWLVVAFALYAAVMNRVQWTPPRWLVVSQFRYAWLIPLTILPQSLMGLLYPTFGPDTSAGLVPMPHVLFYYGIFFFFGAIYFDAGDQTGRLGRWWLITLPVALLFVFPLGYDLTHGGFGFASRWIDPEYHRSVAVVLQVVYVWLMTFGLMGLFRSLLSRKSRTMRYVSDSSYWLYLAHLPLIIVAQAVVRTWEINALAKFTVICVATTGLLLVSYQLFVRHTPIGTLLNGPRKRPQPIVDAVLVEPAGAAEAS